MKVKKRVKNLHAYNARIGINKVIQIYKVLIVKQTNILCFIFYIYLYTYAQGTLGELLPAHLLIYLL